MKLWLKMAWSRLWFEGRNIFHMSFDISHLSIMSTDYFYTSRVEMGVRARIAVEMANEKCQMRYGKFRIPKTYEDNILR